MSGRTWWHLQERLADLASLGAELHAGLEQGEYRFLLAVIAPMATDAARLASDLETVLRNEMAENGVELPPLDLGTGGAP
ncbi:hypothetical protein [Streptacidiphilus neutrinimicus]|uniref:hypothetical protein n=1 Tax=Streptacidiphilus neutrinimicus TaxID=105420 RepID=UPI0005A94C27|nr:hypothetical protein [Streptacidiphilus neutrinimicus]